jgi:hypothetical protein
MSGHRIGASDLHLSDARVAESHWDRVADILMGDAWQKSSDRTLVSVRLVILTDASGRPETLCSEGANDSLCWGSLYKCGNRLWLTLLANSFENTP